MKKLTKILDEIIIKTSPDFKEGEYYDFLFDTDEGPKWFNYWRLMRIDDGIYYFFSTEKGIHEMEYTEKDLKKQIIRKSR